MVSRKSAKLTLEYQSSLCMYIINVREKKTQKSGVYIFLIIKNNWEFLSKLLTLKSFLYFKFDSVLSVWKLYYEHLRFKSTLHIRIYGQRYHSDMVTIWGKEAVVDGDGWWCVCRGINKVYVHPSPLLPTHPTRFYTLS